MKNRVIGLLATVSICLLGACTATLQTTSGADYLAAYDDPAYQQSTTDLDAEIREIAAIEPNLRFPARIGLARVDRGGKLINMPVEEGYLWQEAGETLGADFGEFVPVNPLIATTVTVAGPRGRNFRKSALADIRRGAARQHLDYVLIYEVTTTDAQKANILSIGDATLLGLFILPSRQIEVEAVTSALLMDVRNGYPYATITEYTEKTGLARGARQRARKEALSDVASLNAVEALIGQTGLVLKELADQQASVAMAEAD